MKSFLLSVIVSILCIPLPAQNSAGNSVTTTVYKDFQPALITLTNGKSITQKKANVFLKNGSLVYKHNKFTMQADMSKIQTVKFTDRTYLRVDTLLAYIVDTLEANKLLCATLIDINAYKTQLLNNRQITNLELGVHVNVTSTDNSADEDKLYPLINYFFYEIDGKIIRAHERAILKMLPKEKQRQFKIILQSPDFDWGNTDYLIKILRLLKK